MNSDPEDPWLHRAGPLGPEARGFMRHLRDSTLDQHLGHEAMIVLLADAILQIDKALVVEPMSTEEITSILNGGVPTGCAGSCGEARPHHHVQTLDDDRIILTEETRHTFVPGRGDLPGQHPEAGYSDVCQVCGRHESEHDATIDTSEHLQDEQGSTTTTHGCVNWLTPAEPNDAIESLARVGEALDAWEECVGNDVEVDWPARTVLDMLDKIRAGEKP